MRSRITICLTDEGTIEIFLNEAGPDLLVKELLALSEKSDHFHLGPPEIGEVETSSIAFSEGESVIEYGKVSLRLDEWDKKYNPHVLGE